MTDGLTVELHDPRDAYVPEDWDKFVETASLQAIWKWSFVRANAAGRPGRGIAAIIRDSDTVVGLANVLLRGPHLNRFGVGIADLEAPGTTALPGIAFAGTHGGIRGLGTADPILVHAAIRALETNLRRTYRRSVALIWYRNVFASMLPVLLDGAALTYAGDPIAYFHNEFADYDRYLASISQKRRGDQRRLSRRIEEDPSLTITWGPIPAGFPAERLNALIDGTSRRNHHRRFPPKRVSPPGLRDAVLADPGTIICSYVRDDELIAAVVSIDHPTVPIELTCGAIDPHRGGRTGIWFDQQARVLKWVIGTGRDGVISGKGMIDLKVDLGHRAIPQWSVLRPMGHDD